MGVRRKIFYPMAFASMLFASSAMAKINPTAFVGVTEYFLKDKSKDMTFYSPTLGEAALELGLIENIRFNGAFTRGMKEGARDYTQDSSKDPLWNVVKILFPSNNGQLGTVTNATTNFARYVKNPKVAALLLNYAKQVEDVKGKGNLSAKVTQQFSAEILKTLEGLGEGKSTIENFKKVTLNPLLNAIRESIETEKKGTSLSPRHTTEQVIEAFFCYQFNTQDDIWELIKNLDGSIVDKSKPLPTQAHYLEEKDLPQILAKSDFNLDDIFDLTQASLFTSLTPYKAGVNLLNNGQAYPYDREKNTQIKTNAFPDCVETASRHLFNLTLFNPIQREFDLTAIEAFVKSREESTGEKNPYFENFKNFYAHQKLLMANAGDIGIRSLWNTVVANLPHTAYRNENGNEIKSGFVNLLKTFETIFSLPLKTSPESGLGEKKAWVEDSLQILFSALNPAYAYKIQLQDNPENREELFGNALITVSDKAKGNNLFFFNLRVAGGHTEVNKLELLTKQNAVDYTEAIAKHRDSLKKGTAEESLLLLASPDLQKDIHPFYRLYSQPLNDNATKIAFLNTLSDHYESWKTEPSIKNNIHLIKDIAKNVMSNIGLSDPAVAREALPVIQKLRQNPDFELPDHIDNILSNLPVFDLSGTQNFDEVFLKGLPSLTALELFRSSVKNLDGLETLSSLKTLNLGNTERLKKLSLKGLENLKTLNLGDSAIEEVEGLEGLVNLEVLQLEKTAKLKAISLKGLKSLVKLDLSRSNVDSVKDLDTLSNLEQLNLRRALVEEISFKGLTNLKELILDESAVKKVTHLGALSNLQYLDLGFTRNLDEISLNGLAKVKKISFWNSNVKKIEGLETLSNLEDLELHGVKNLEKMSVKGLTNLKSLNVSGAKMTEIEGLNFLSNLRDLNVEDSAIASLNGLNFLHKLQRLNLQGAKNIQELEFTQDNKDLRLQLQNSGIKNRSQIKGIEHLDEDKITW